MDAEPEIVVRADDEMDLEVIDGCLVNAGGQVVGVAEFSDVDEVVNEEMADAMLAKIAAVEGQLVALRVQRDAILANVAAREKGHMNRLGFLRMRYGPLLEAYAARRLKHSKRRSLQLTNGLLAFRKTPGGAKITDMVRAVAFVKSLERADLVRVTTKEDVPAGIVREFVDYFREHNQAPPSELDFLEITPPGDKFAAKTGILDEPGIAPTTEP